MVETRSGAKVLPEGIEHQAHSPPRTPIAGDRSKRVPAHKPGAAGYGLQGPRPISLPTAYTLLAAIYIFLALPCIATPQQMARSMFGGSAFPPELQHSHLLRLLGCVMLAVASVSMGLEEASRKHMLASFTADTLKAVLTAFAGASLLLQLYYPLTLTPLASILVSIVGAATLALPASQLIGREDLPRVRRDFGSLPGRASNLITLRKQSVVGALYLMLTWVYPLAGVACFTAPRHTLYHTFGYVYGKSTILLWKAMGLGLLTLFPAMTYTLKDKAEADLLGRSIPRTLNLGLLLVSLGHLLVLGSVHSHHHGGPLLLPLLALWLTSMLAAMGGLGTMDVREATEKLEEVGGTLAAAAVAAGDKMAPPAGLIPGELDDEDGEE